MHDSVRPAEVRLNTRTMLEASTYISAEGQAAATRMRFLGRSEAGDDVTPETVPVTIDGIEHVFAVVFTGFSREGQVITLLNVPDRSVDSDDYFYVCVTYTEAAGGAFVVLQAVYTGTYGEITEPLIALLAG